MTILATHKTLPDTNTQGHPATAIVVNPASGISSTNVQAALEEISTETTTQDNIIQSKINLLLMGF